MRVLAINGSPRKKGNTAILLEQAINGAKSQGADTETIHLYDLVYKGCISCFVCKKHGTAGAGICALHDDLSPVLEKAMNANAILLGSPIYLSDVTGMMRSFMERLIFMNLTYDDPYRKAPGKAISSAFFYTMNLPREAESYYKPIFEANSNAFGCLGGSTEYMPCFDTYQFDDYSKYAAGIFDVAHKEQIRSEQFPIDCQRAFDIGAKLASV